MKHKGGTIKQKREGEKKKAECTVERGETKGGKGQKKKRKKNNKVINSGGNVEGNGSEKFSKTRYRGGAGPKRIRKCK